MKRCLLILTVLSGTALAQRPQPVLSLSVNGKRTAEVPKGWPLLVRAALMHSERLNRSANVPALYLAPADRAWPDAIVLRVRDRNGMDALLQIPLLNLPEQNELVLPHRSYVEVEWAIEGAAAEQLLNGDYVIDAVMEVKDSRGWNGLISSPPVKVTIVDPSEDPEARASKELLTAAIELRRGNPAKAAGILDALLETSPSYTRALGMRAEIAEQAGDLALGLAFASRAVSAATEKRIEGVEPPVDLLRLRNRLLTRLTASNAVSMSLATVSAARFTPGVPLAPGVIAAGYGTDLASTIEIAPATGSLPTVLAQTSVIVKDSAGVERTAPLWFVSPNQINYYIPEETALGWATITVVRNSQAVATGTLEINTVAPGLFTMNANGQGVPAALAVFARDDGSQTWRYVFSVGCAVGTCQPIPLDLGPATDTVVLQLYGTGIRGRSGLAWVAATVGDVLAPVEYAGPVSGMVGLDQVNLRLPRSLVGRGEVDVVLTVDGKTANKVRVNIR